MLEKRAQEALPLAVVPATKGWTTVPGLEGGLVVAIAIAAITAVTVTIVSRVAAVSSSPSSLLAVSIPVSLFLIAASAGTLALSAAHALSSCSRFVDLGVRHARISVAMSTAAMFVCCSRLLAAGVQDRPLHRWDLGWFVSQ
jgi:hypothetical protein